MSDLVRLSRLLTFAEYEKMNEEAIERGFWRDDRRIFLPGMAWPTPWVWDQAGEMPTSKRVIFPAARRGDLNYLSPHYWRDWADRRPPLCVVCPNGEQWEIDRKSSNGNGWRVTGEWPNLTCHPSIVVEGYHGWLRNGEFSADLEGRGPTGLARPISDRAAEQ